jgi:hypothetical protein
MDKPTIWIIVLCVILVIVILLLFQCWSKLNKTSGFESAGEKAFALQMAAIGTPRYNLKVGGASAKKEGLEAALVGASSPEPGTSLDMPVEGKLAPVSRGAFDYQEFLVNHAIDDATKKTHAEFVYDLPLRSSTASMAVERDDRIDINSWIGLRRPVYNSAAQSQPESRQVSSESPDQMPDNSQFVVI